MNNTDRKTAADRLLYELGLFDKLAEIGKPYIIGSYRMDMMVWNDLDIDIENEDGSVTNLGEKFGNKKNEDLH